MPEGGAPVVTASARETPILVRVWDLPTRLFKWSLVLCVVLAWATNKFATEHPQWHKWNGYAVLVLIAFRILWGFFGSFPSRFAAFIPSPRQTLAYALALFRGGGPKYLGHTPLGAWMILALLVATATQAIIGLYSADEDRLVIEGPLAHTVSDAAVDKAASLHRLGFNIILVLASVHILANILYDVIGRSGLVRSMITGDKRVDPEISPLEPAKASGLRALACLIVATGIVFGAIAALGGRNF